MQWVGGCRLAAQQPLMDVFLVPLLPWGRVVPSPPCWAEVKACFGVVYPQLPACCFAGGLRSALLSNLTACRADCRPLKGQGPGVLYIKSPMTSGQRAGGP